MLKQNFSDIVVLCDFDGTLCRQDVFDEIMDHFTGKDWRKFGLSYEKNEISHSEMSRKAVNLLKVFPRDLNQFLSQKIKIRKDFQKFRNYCKQLRIPFIIASTGGDYYIKQVLDNERLCFFESEKDFQKINTDNLNIIANKLRFSDSKSRWTISFPWGEKTKCFCQCSPCKSQIIKYLKNHGKKMIVGIGDGLSDRCMTHKVDHLFARGSLKDYCKKNNIFFHKFDDFRDVQKTFDGLLSKLAN